MRTEKEQRVLVNDLSWIKTATVIVAWGGALLCLIYVLRLHSNTPARRRQLQAFYGGQALLLLLLGLNRKWELLNAFTSYSRLTAMREGWYNTRRLAQFDLIVSLGVAALLILLLTAWSFRPILRRHGVPLLVAIGLLTYVGIRTVSLHAVDAIILDRVLGVPWDWLIELAGICLLLGTLILAFHWQQRTVK